VSADYPSKQQEVVAAYGQLLDGLGLRMIQDHTTREHRVQQSGGWYVTRIEILGTKWSTNDVRAIQLNDLMMALSPPYPVPEPVLDPDQRMALNTLFRLHGSVQRLWTDLLPLLLERGWKLPDQLGALKRMKETTDGL
jgi:hypothetical protein